jgi:hypothetical protein
MLSLLLVGADLSCRRRLRERATAGGCVTTATISKGTEKIRKTDPVVFVDRTLSTPTYYQDRLHSPTKRTATEAATAKQSPSGPGSHVSGSGNAVVRSSCHWAICAYECFCFVRRVHQNQSRWRFRRRCISLADQPYSSETNA